jgi:hypothetical protein
MNHLTDDQIQIYLDNIKSEDINMIENHLQKCEKCRLNLNTFQQIYKVLGNKDAVPILSSNFVQTTINKIEKANDKKWNIFENIVLAFLFIISISMSIYFFNLSSIVSYFKTIDFSIITGIVDKVIGGMSFNIIYLIAAILISISVELIDRIRIQK